jgi:hypothetical protein
MTEKKGAVSSVLSNTHKPKPSRPRSLRKAIDANCRSCVYDPANAGNWRQQVTMCSCHDCAIYPVRPVSSSDIPERILDAYSVPEWERSRFAGPRRSFYETNPPPNTSQATYESVFVEKAKKAL